jgi:hypothetical protein
LLAEAYLNLPQSGNCDLVARRKLLSLLKEALRLLVFAEIVRSTTGTEIGLVVEIFGWLVFPANNGGFSSIFALSS